MPRPHAKLSVRRRVFEYTLISVTSDEDFENMMEEYNKLSSSAASNKW